MRIVVRLLPHDRWHEYDLPPDATVSQLKITVLQHWDILPHILPTGLRNSPKDGSLARVQSSTSHGSSSATSIPDARRGTLKSPHCHAPPSPNSVALEEPCISLPRSKEESKRTSWGSSGGAKAADPANGAHTELLYECARIMASYSFRSVCCGCFLPEEAVLSKCCVENDMLVIQSRSHNISIPYKEITTPFLRMTCGVHFVQVPEGSPGLNEGSKATLFFPDYPAVAHKNARPSTASSIVSSSGRSFSQQFTRSADRKYKHVRLQVFGETMWLHRTTKDGEHEAENDYLKRYTLPAVLCTPTSNPSEGYLLKLGFLNGDIIIVKAKNEADWNDLLACLGPTGTASGSESAKQSDMWRKDAYNRAVQANIGLSNATNKHPRAKRSKTPAARSHVKGKSSHADLGGTVNSSNETNTVPVVDCLQNCETAPGETAAFPADMQLQRSPSKSSSLVHVKEEFPQETAASAAVDARLEITQSPGMPTGRTPSFDSQGGDCGSSGRVLLSPSPRSSVTSSPVSGEWPQSTGRMRVQRLQARDDRRAYMASRSLDGGETRRYFSDDDQRDNQVARAF